MCYKNLFKVIIPFFVLFIMGILSVKLFISKETSEPKQAQPNIQNISTVSETTEFSVCKDKNSFYKEIHEIDKWLYENKNAPKDQKATKKKELRELEEKLLSITKSEELENKSEKDSIGQNLVIRRKCY